MVETLCINCDADILADEPNCCQSCGRPLCDACYDLSPYCDDCEEDQEVEQA